MGLERALIRMARLCTGLGALSLAVMMLATDYDIVARLTFKSPLHGVVELVEIMVLASAMLGLPEAFLRDEQIRVDLVDNWLPPFGLRIVKVVALILTVVFLGILSFNVYGPMIDAWRFGDLKADLGLPVYPLYGLILLSLAASILTCLVVFVRLVSSERELQA